MFSTFNFRQYIKHRESNSLSNNAPTLNRFNNISLFYILYLRAPYTSALTVDLPVLDSGMTSQYLIRSYRRWLILAEALKTEKKKL